MSRIYVPQIKETVLIIWVSQEPGVDFPVEADTVFSHIVHSLRNSNIQVCLVRTTLTQTSTNALGAVIKTSSYRQDLYEKDPDGRYWDKVNDDALMQELTQLGI